ncbi:CotH kinase family protein [Bacteroidota bacterium]
MFINEILASNTNNIMDPDFNAHRDWIEIYNNSDKDINLNGYFVSDNYTNPTKYRIDEDILVPSKTYLIIWCDDRDTILQAIHTNFKLKASEYRIALYSADTSLIDSVSFTHQKTDISYGRVPDSYCQWASYGEVTPGKINSNKGHRLSLKPLVSLRSGYYESDQKIFLLSKDPSVIVRYTLDGTDPTETSALFPDTLLLTNRTSEPNVFSAIPTNKDPYGWLPPWISPTGNVFKATVIKLCSFDKEKRASDIVYYTYFIADNMISRYDLPVVSIITNPEHFFDDTTGIYVPGIFHEEGESGTGNYFQDWEKEVHITYFDPEGSIGFSQNAGIRIQGGSSPASSLKAFHVIARNKYGNDRFSYPLFKETKGNAKNIQQYKRFIIRAWGSCILNAMFNDALAHRIMEKSDLDLQAYQPIILFINGEYWGLHEMREANKSNWYFEVHHGVDTDNPGIDLIYHHDRGDEHHPEANEGDIESWNNLTEYIHGHDLSKKECYDYVKTQVDIENLINYIAQNRTCSVIWDRAHDDPHCP